MTHYLDLDSIRQRSSQNYRPSLSIETQFPNIQSSAPGIIQLHCHLTIGQCSRNLSIELSINKAVMITICGNTHNFLMAWLVKMSTSNRPTSLWCCETYNCLTRSLGDKYTEMIKSCCICTDSIQSIININVGYISTIRTLWKHTYIMPWLGCIYSHWRERHMSTLSLQW